VGKRVSGEAGKVHLGLAMLGVVCGIVAGVLLYYIVEGISFYGVDVQVTVALAVAAAVVAAITAFLLYKVFRASLAKVKTGREALIGARGVAVTDLKPRGEVRVLSEFWQATVKDGEVGSGVEVEIVGMDGLVLEVRRVEEKA
jgi:membrane-bound serine protease (ClpP class)